MSGHILNFNCKCGLNCNSISVGVNQDIKLIEAFYDPSNQVINSEISENISPDMIKIKDPFLMPLSSVKMSTNEFIKALSKNTEVIYCPACKKNELTVNLIGHWCC